MKDTRRLTQLFPVIAVLFFVSGSTALVYEVVWLRSLLLVFGSTTFAASTVLTSFMAGLAAGSWGIGRWIDGRGRPLLVYGVLEIGIGLYALASPHLFQAVEPLYRVLWVGLDPPPLLFALARFALCFLVLFLPTALMGGTLPALSRFAAGLPQGMVGSVGRLYGLNTLGAFGGTLLAGFLLLPGFGLTTTLGLTAGVNIVVGLLSVGIAVAAAKGGEESAQNAGVAVSDDGWKAPVVASRLRRRLIVICFALTGCAALVLEVAWTRVLTLVIGPSVYAFSLMLAGFLGGLGLGALIFSWVMDRFRWRGSEPFVALSMTAGLFAFVTLLAFARLPLLYASLFQRWDAIADPRALFSVGALVSGCVILPATLAMGGLFPAALEAFGIERGAAGRDVGALYAANGGGAIIGAFAGGFLFIPTLGLQGTVLAAAWLYLLVAGGMAWATRAAPRAKWLAPAVLLMGPLLFASAPSWDRALMSSGVYHYLVGEDGTVSIEEYERSLETYDILFYEEGLISTILVAREVGVYEHLGDSGRVPSVLLVTGGKVDASSVHDMPTQILSAHLPLLLHPAPKRVAVIGLASGTTAGSALRHDLESLDVVEIEPAVVTASHQFDFVNGRPLEDPRTRVTVADGRTFLLLEDRRFDVIVSEPSNPWMSGVSNLFTREFFELARERLAQDGIFGQWVQMYGMSPQNLRVLLRTFQSVFPQSFVFNTIPYTDLLLIGSADGLVIDPEALQQRIDEPDILADLQRAGVTDAADLLARGRMGPAELATLRGASEILNTDDNAFIEFRAPLDLYRSTRAANEQQLESAAAGLAPYLTPGDLEARRALLLQLASLYRERGYLAEADEADRVLEGLTPSAR
ncbi:MAG TPA: fused MFS/spermidine synthase [Gemmatimonadota bacterium]|nr:fused MFS/spermidine synthase [Gemmatimonadota bacterium]